MAVISHCREKMWNVSRQIPRFGWSTSRTRSHECSHVKTCWPHASASYAIRLPYRAASSAAARRSRTIVARSPTELGLQLEHSSIRSVCSSFIHWNFLSSRSRLRRSSSGVATPSRSRNGWNISIVRPSSWHAR